MDKLEESQRWILLDILQRAGRTARDSILEIREQRKGEQIGETGHQTATTLSSTAPGVVQSAIKNHANNTNFEVDCSLHLEYESTNFRYDFNKGLPLLVVDEVDGQKAIGRFQSQRTILETRLQKPGWDLFYTRPDSAICMALFEGTKLEDITLSVTTTMQGDVFS